MNNAILLAPAFKEEVGGGIFVPRAAGITMRARVRPFFVPVSMTTSAWRPYLPRPGPRQALKHPGVSVVFGSTDLTTLALPNLPALYVILAEWDWRERNAIEPTCCSPGSVWPVPSPVAERNRGGLCHQVTVPLSGGRSDVRRASSEDRCQAGQHGDD